MSDQNRELASWQKGKTTVISQYMADHKKIITISASQGFSILPGHVYEEERNLELAIKSNLSELNYKILVETIEREMKQSGIDYDLAYRSAAIAWEVEKQGLLAAWDEELAGIKKGMADQEETLNQLAISVGTRSIYIIERKTEIELEAETYRQQIAALDGTIAPYEVSLAQQKLLTAQKKLDIIPILQEILTKEQSLLATEQSKAAYYTQLMVAEQAVASKKESTLKPAILALSNKSEEYVSELTVQIALERQIADEKVAQAEAQVDNIESKVAIEEQELETAEIQVSIEEQKLLLQTVRDDMESDLLEEEISHVQELTAAESSSNDTILDYEESTQAYVLDKQRSTENKQNETKTDSSQTLTDAEKDNIRTITNSEVSKIRRIAEINAESILTAKLTHLIG